MKIALKQVALLLSCALLPAATRAQSVVGNQVGYERGATGSAFVISTQRLPAGSIVVRSAAGTELAHIQSVQRDPLLSAWVARIALTPTRDGPLTLSVSGAQERTFQVAERPYDALLRSVLHSYALQRCGVEIHAAPGGGARPACHLDDGIRAHADEAGQADEPVAAPGGWHDAGDYGKYVATTATVVLELLTRAERFPALLALDDLAIAESQDGMPDLLNEMRVGLDWMLLMQRPDGAVYRKLSGARWPSDLTPQYDRQVRYVYGVSSPETAKAAAAWALAARVFKPHAPELAERYLAAAIAAWNWLQSVPSQRFDFQEGDDAGSGPYRKNSTDREPALERDADDRLAMAIELYLTTGGPSYAALVDKLLFKQPLELFEWKNVAGNSLVSLLWHPAAAKHSWWRARVAQDLRTRARTSLRRAEAHDFAMANHHIVWGSNKLTAAEGSLLLAAARVEVNGAPFARAARAQLDYLLGANPLDKCFVTGFGDNPVRHVSHIFLRVSGESISGLMVGGPNTKEQSNIGPRAKGILSYADDARSYATNEYAIDYNSALAALLLDLSAQQRQPYVEP